MTMTLKCHFSNLENVGEYLLRLSVEVGVDEGDVVVAGDHVPQRRETLLHPLDLDGVRQRVPEGMI